MFGLKRISKQKLQTMEKLMTKKIAPKAYII
jgi:hypothetical protein